MFVPEQFGGSEIDLPAGLDIVRQLSAIDGSIGWISAIFSSTTLMVPKLPVSSLNTIYRAGPDQRVAGNGSPVGAGVRVAGGWRVTGRWPLASGCEAADWLAAGFTENSSDSSAQSRNFILLLPADQFHIEQTWDAAGLRGTGSHHISIEDAYIEDEFIGDLFSAQSSIDAPLYRQPLASIYLMHCAVHLGIAEAAISDAVTVLRQKHIDNDTTGKREYAYLELGICDAKLKACDALFERTVRSHWLAATEGSVGGLNSLPVSAQSAAYTAREMLAIFRWVSNLRGPRPCMRDPHFSAGSEISR